MADEPMLIVDGHLDIAFNALFYRRDQTQTVTTLREREDPVRRDVSAHPDSLERRGGPWSQRSITATVSLPALREGGVGIVLGTIMARVEVGGAGSLVLDNAGRTQAIAWAQGRGHLAYYQALERRGEIRLIRSTQDLLASVAAWADPKRDTPIGLILSMESADPIWDADDVAHWWDAGLRSVSLTHFGANTYGHGTGTRGGLYPPAYPLMDALKAAGVALDVSHLSDVSFWQVMDYWDGPIHASHCVCRALVPGQRHLTDEMIRALCDRGAVIGMVFCERMLNPRWNWDDPPTDCETSERPMRAAVEHIDHICALTGSSDHVAIGSDLDGGFGREHSPTDLDTVADLQRFPDILRDRGYTDVDVAKIAHGNLIRFFSTAWEDA